MQRELLSIGVLNKVNLEMDNKVKLLGLCVPSYRQAYSDRTAWIMATLSELAYLRYNQALPSKLQKIGLNEALDRLVDESTNINATKALLVLESLLWDHEKEKQRLINELNTLNEATLLETFDTEFGTQAILVETRIGYVLSFRETEATSLNDIKSDAKAMLTKCKTSGRSMKAFTRLMNR